MLYISKTVQISIFLIVGIFFYPLHAMEALMDRKLSSFDKQKCLNVARYLVLTDSKINEDERKRRAIFLSTDHSKVKKVNKYIKLFNDHMDSALSFVNSIPFIKISDLYSQINELDKKTFRMIVLLSKSEKVLVTLQKDIFTTLIKGCLPQSFDDKANFFGQAKKEEKEQEQHEIGQFGFPVKKVVQNIVVRKQMIAALSDMSVEQALYMFNYITQPQGEVLEDHFDFPKDDGCSTGSRCVHTPTLNYYWTFQDHKDFTDIQRNLLDNIVKQSNKADSSYADAYIGERFLIKDEHLDILKVQMGERALKDFIQQNKKFAEAKIRVDIEKTTACERLCDRLLYCIPHAAVMIFPELIYAYTNNTQQIVAGFIGNLCASALFGYCVYPHIDSYNSNRRKLSCYFGPNNQYKNRKHYDFLFIGFIHYLATVCGQKLLSLQALPLKALGVILYALRTMRSLHDLYRLEKIHNENSFKRRSKKGLPFILEDLVKGPLFDSVIN